MNLQCPHTKSFYVLELVAGMITNERLKCSTADHVVGPVGLVPVGKIAAIIIGLISNSKLMSHQRRSDAKR